jgi:hypothetical protein
MLQINACHLIGCGGTGSHLALPLLQLLLFQNGTRDFIFYDGDIYESNNFTRQVMSQIDLGVNKATATTRKLSQSFSNVSLCAVEEYVKPALLTAWLSQYERNQEDTWQLVVLAVDNNATRHELMKAIDNYPGKVICVLPGNGYHTCNVLWYMSDEKGKALPIHPFQLAPNWKKPTDFPRHSCQYEADSSPQLIIANFSAAMLTLSVIRALLDDRIPPMVLNYNDDKQTLTHEGKLV